MKDKFCVEVVADSGGKWACNALRFDSKAEAEAYGRDLAARWTAVREWRVSPGALRDLLSDLKNGFAELTDDLLAFGGDEPEDTHGVWSWDDADLIVGTCTDDLEIVTRCEHAAEARMARAEDIGGVER
jgi:hypothetical protein